LRPEKSALFSAMRRFWVSSSGMDSSFMGFASAINVRALLSFALCVLGHDLPSDQPAADFARAGADLVELGVAQQAAGGEVVDVAVAAEKLDGIERHARCPFGGVEDAAGSVLAGCLAAVA